MTRVGFVGTGRMGGPMVRRLVESGHDVRALGRSDEKRRAVQELGAQAAADLGAVADGADVVVVCVFTDEQVQEVCGELVGAMPRGATLVNVSRLVAPTPKSSIERRTPNRWSCSITVRAAS